MIQSNENIQFKNPSEDVNDDEIDLSAILRIFLRRKFIILSFGFVGFLYGFILGKIEIPTWEGEFQIVLSNEENSSSNSLSRFLQSSGGRTFGNVIGLSRGTGISSKLLTEVEILKSPYSLMDNFKNFKKRKNSYEKKIY